MFELNDDNLMMYAMKHYDKPQYIMSDFEEDFKRIQYLKKLFYRYRNKQDLQERLILNHIIVLYNVFGAEATTRMLFYKLESMYYPALKAFLEYLKIMPDVVQEINGCDLQSTSIETDSLIATKLKEI